MKPKVGDELYLVETYHRREPEGRKCTVSKVGRKYFTVEWRVGADCSFAREATFDLESGREKNNFHSNLRLYLSEGHRNQEQERSAILDRLRVVFSYGNNNFSHVSLDSLRSIEALLKGKEQ